MNQTLYEVYTFAEATRMLNMSPAFLNKLVKQGKLIKNMHYREAGRNKLITKEAIIRIAKIRGIEVSSYFRIDEVNR